MLGFLAASYRRLSERKLRLFAAYCCRNILHPETEEEVKRAVDLCEAYAEGRASASDLYAADGPVTGVWQEYFGSDRVSAAAFCLTRYGIENPLLAAQGASENGIDAARFHAGTGTASSEAVLQAAWLRDIFPSPFRPKFVSRDWFAWNAATATTLAEQMYQSQDFSAMPLLADALQDAGCDCDDILNHCRDANATHVRGCWVCDLVLGRG
jgi:hypothetical protein